MACLLPMSILLNNDKFSFRLFFISLFHKLPVSISSIISSIISATAATCWFFVAVLFLPFAQCSVFNVFLYLFFFISLLVHFVVATM